MDQVLIIVCLPYTLLEAGEVFSPALCITQNLGQDRREKRSLKKVKPLAKMYKAARNVGQRWSPVRRASSSLHPATQTRRASPYPLPHHGREESLHAMKCISQDMARPTSTYPQNILYIFSRPFSPSVFPACFMSRRNMDSCLGGEEQLRASTQLQRIKGVLIKPASKSPVRGSCMTELSTASRVTFCELHIDKGGGCS